MQHATLRDLTGWSEEECLLIDRRLDTLDRWRQANGRNGRAVEAVFPLVDSWSRGRGSFEIWAKCTRSLISREIADHVRARHPELESEAGCADVLQALSNGSVLDLDGYWVEAFEKIDFDQPVERTLGSVVDAIRTEGAMCEASAAPAP
jgi:hypothetical protein